MKVLTFFDIETQIIIFNATMAFNLVLYVLYMVRKALVYKYLLKSVVIIFLGTVSMKKKRNDFEKYSKVQLLI